MKRIAMLAALTCMCTYGVASLLACPPESGDVKATQTKSAQVASAKEGGCCAGKAMACCEKNAFPTMKIMVADKSYNCPIEAAKVAKESNAKVVYIVAGEKYDCKDKATVALADAADEYVDHFTKIACVVNGNPIYCDSEGKAGGCCKAGAKSDAKTTVAKAGDSKAAKTGASDAHECCMKGAAKDVKFMVLGKTYDTKADAEKARDAALAVVKKISMKAVVDGKETTDCEHVCPMAEKAGQVDFVINGEKTHCRYQARIMMAKAKYEAARGTLENKKVASNS